MIKFGDVIYYIDFKQMDKVVTIIQSSDKQRIESIQTTEIYDSKGNLTNTSVIKIEKPIDKEIDLLKYESIKTLIDVVLNSDTSDLDTTMGSARALRGTSIDFQMAFNTLLKEGILKETA